MRLTSMRLRAMLKTESSQPRGDEGSPPEGPPGEACWGDASGLARWPASWLAGWLAGHVWLQLVPRHVVPLVLLAAQPGFAVCSSRPHRLTQHIWRNCCICLAMCFQTNVSVSCLSFLADRFGVSSSFVFVFVLHGESLLCCLCSYLFFLFLPNLFLVLRLLSSRRVSSFLFLVSSCCLAIRSKLIVLKYKHITFKHGDQTCRAVRNAVLAGARKQIQVACFPFVAWSDSNDRNEYGFWVDLWIAIRKLLARTNIS